MSLRTVQRIGKKQQKIGSSATHITRPAAGVEKLFCMKVPIFPWFLILSLLTIFLLEEKIVIEHAKAFQRKCQRIAKQQLVFIDETNLETQARPRRGLHAPGLKANVSAITYPSFQGQVNFIGAISYNGWLAYETLTPSERQSLGVRGWNKTLVKDFLRKKLAKKLNGLSPKGVIVCHDTGLKFQAEEIKEELQAGGATKVKDAWILPTDTGKYVNPLDNNFWHEMKDLTRDMNPQGEDDLARKMGKAFNPFSSKSIWRAWEKTMHWGNEWMSACDSARETK